MKHIPPEIGTLHFVGIGGIGMSGIAEALAVLGYDIQGSDLTENYNVDRLRARGLNVKIGHAAENLQTSEGKLPGAVVVSSAIKQDNPELMEARAKRIPIVQRAEMLAELMRLKWAVAIAGTHGKTTTTSLVGAMLEAGDIDPTVINGGIVNSYGTNARLGNGDWIVVEADESDGSFKMLPATVAVVTNIDPEHMEHYGSFDNVRQAYLDYIERIPFYGFAVLCIDHPVVQGLIPEIENRPIVTYGFNKQADVRAVNIRSSVMGSLFDVEINDGELVLSDVFLPMMGIHNVQNALAAIAIGYKLRMTAIQMKNALSTFEGVKRRFTRTGMAGGITVIDDYGHHPVEIAAVLKAGRQAVGDGKGRIIAVVQPHRYSRLHDLFDEFCTCFDEADVVLVADVYAAGEQPIEGVSKESLVDGIKSHGHRHVDVMPDSSLLAAQIASIAEAGDMVICLGAGSITYWAHDLPDQLDALQKQKMSA
ncbi:MAG: UDP-N-acetylmuramate--L-alanine ligase [Alphaproteobacteria bacterium RIFCSPHIGHO2_12_FULL_45_9]|nr:MAG: UDP-N-acetylmuramate--L-alanine ligase [Alphaproteobacteria bacterium RIFCSPHIGHO2_12_FULL_45_9]